MADLTLRSVKGSPLTNAELDGNFEYFTGSHAVTGSLTVTEDLIVNGSIIGNISGSVLITTITGVQVTGSLVVSGSNTFTNIGPMKTGAVNNVALQNSMAQGFNVTASGLYSHAEGFTSRATGDCAHAEGQQTLAQGGNSHSEGVYTSALGDFSHAEGYSSIALGYASHAEGLFTVASASYQHVQGAWNILSPVTGAFIIGNGSGPSYKSNLIFAAGNQVEITGSLVVTGGITGSLLGTATSASFAATSSYALTAQTLLGSVTSASYAATASVLLGSVTSASFAATASFVQNAQQATSVYTFATDSNSTYYPAFVGASFSSYNTLTVDSGGQFSYNPSTNTLTVPNIAGTSSFATTASYALTAQTLLGSVTSASYAATASYVNLVAGPNITINQVGTAFQISGSGGGSVVVPGNDTEVLFNNAGNLGASSDFKFDYNYLSLSHGNSNLASGTYSHAEGVQTKAQGGGSHAEGQNTTAFGAYSHAEGSLTYTLGQYSHAEGRQTSASATYSHAEGILTKALGQSSHAEGGSTQAIGENSHAEGQQTIAQGGSSHAEGVGSISTGDFSHAEGSGNESIGYASHAEGFATISLGSYSHAEGYYTIASGSYQHVQGQYNTHGDTTSLMIVGNGTISTRRDAFKVRQSGSIVLPTTQSAAPSWTGTDGEMVFATVTGAHYFYVWMSGAWRSGSLS